VLTVVKVGGALARDAAAVRAWCAEIAACGARHPLLVVPGGGGFADAVRDYDRRVGLRAETAHWMAILAMDQLGWALADLIPGAVRVSDLRPSPPAGAVRVLLPARLLMDRDPLPRSWDVTADAIAAWVAGEVGAARVVLVKPVAGLYATWPPAGDPLASITLDELVSGGVDAWFPTALRAAGVEAWVVDGRSPERLVELLDTGATTGTRIVRE
jgi:5-(aminomethyl)-3-furanmethanol phosphate kinase